MNKDTPQSSPAELFPSTNYNTKLKPNSFLTLSIQGLLILVPLVGIFYILNYLYGKIHNLVTQVMEYTDIQRSYVAVTVILISIVLIFLIAYFIGWLTRYSNVKSFASKMDEFLTLNVPAYRSVKTNFDNKAQFSIQDKPPIFVEFSDYKRPGFLMQGPMEDGSCVVFIPKDFASLNGNIYIVPQEKIFIAKSDKQDFLYALDHLGAGLNLSSESVSVLKQS